MPGYSGIPVLFLEAAQSQAARFRRGPSFSTGERGDAATAERVLGRGANVARGREGAPAFLQAAKNLYPGTGGKLYHRPLELRREASIL